MDRVDHVLEADRAYLARLNWKHKIEDRIV
jgi:hypothetical protein